MARQARHDILFDQVAVGPKLLRNRFYGVPFGQGFGAYKPRAQASARAVQAEGGWAVVCTGMTSVSRDADATPLDTLWDERDEQALSLQVAAIHQHAALAGLELGHFGAHSANPESRVPPIAPSRVASTGERPGTWRRPVVLPREMTRSDIERVQLDWVRAAAAGRELGFDIIYVYGSFNFLPAQFLSPFHNRRTDAYGGPLVNRARFWLETLERVRSEVGDACALAVRIAADSLSPVGISLDETLQFIALADPLVDLWDVNLGAEWSRDSGSSRFFSEGYQLEWSGRIREATDKPIVAVGRYTDPDRMAEAVRSGLIDLVGAARPRIADPFLPRKIEEGRYDEIRECTGSNICIHTHWLSQVACIQNPTFGEEYRRGWHPERFTPAPSDVRDVLIVGAGPAGLECAITLARRGVRGIHLVDSNPDVGGHLRWLSRLPGLGEWARVINWRSVQLGKWRRQVTVVLDTQLTVADVLEYGAEVVITSTGARWRSDGASQLFPDAVAGADTSLAHVLTPEQVMLEGKRPPGSRATVYDVDGQHVGSGLAELLQREGHEVDLITPHAVISPIADETLEGDLLRARLGEVGVRQRPHERLDAIGADRIEVQHAYDGRTTRETDGVVLVTQREPVEGLYEALLERAGEMRDQGIKSLHRVGDCVAPRLISDAVFDGHRLARGLGSAAGDVQDDVLRESVV